MGDITKLPKWAQREIESLRRDVASLTQKLGEGPADSDTFLNDYLHGRTPLGVGVRVNFHLSEDDRDDFGQGALEAYVDRRYNDRRLVVRCNHGHLSIQPSSSNVVTIRAVD